jgi:hypothetical protein
VVGKGRRSILAQAPRGPCRNKSTAGGISDLDCFGHQENAPPLYPPAGAGADQPMAIERDISPLSSLGHLNLTTCWGALWKPPRAQLRRDLGEQMRRIDRFGDEFHSQAGDLKGGFAVAGHKYHRHVR